MLYNIYSENLLDIVKNLKGPSLYYTHLVVPQIDESIYYFYRHLGIQAIFRADSVKWFLQSPLSKVDITSFSFMITEKGSNTPVQTTIIQLMLKYGSCDIIDYLIKNKRLTHDLIFNTQEIIKIYDVQSKHLNEILYGPPSKICVDYVYLDVDERARFAQLSHDYMITNMNNMNRDNEDLVDVDYTKSLVKNYFINKYDDFWAYYFKFIKDKLVFDKEFMKYEKLQSLVSFFFKNNLFKSLINLDNIMCDSDVQIIIVTWDNFKSYFRPIIARIFNYNDFSNLMNATEYEREYIMNSYLCDKGIWLKIFDSLTFTEKRHRVHFNNLSTQQFIWIYKNKFFPKRSDLYLIGLAVALDNYNSEMFETLYYYLLNRRLVTKLDIINTLEEIHQSKSDNVDDKFMNAMLDFCKA
uniref:Uncharacterized protein n=1 Tax=viral metagenome TaxID=1070528 RepID=A0A6C0E8K8_9ZZZZ